MQYIAYPPIGSDSDKVGGIDIPLMDPAFRNPTQSAHDPCFHKDPPQPLAWSTTLPCASREKVGLGFAAGAMFWVACFELFVEAAEDSSKTAAFLTTTVSFLVMLCVHRFLGGDGL